MNEIVEAVWIDSSLQDRFDSDVDRPLEPSVLRSVGYVVADTDAYLALARDRHDPADRIARGLVIIPRVAILSSRTLALAAEAPPDKVVTVQPQPAAFSREEIALLRSLAAQERGRCADIERLDGIRRAAGGSTR